MTWRVCARDIIIGKVRSVDPITDRTLISIILLKHGTKLHEVLILQNLTTKGPAVESCVYRSDVELITSVTETRNKAVWSQCCMAQRATW